MPIISVIVPVYNTEKYLRKCIESILLQTFVDLEIILVDDGSTDSSGTICDEYSKKDNRVRVLHIKNSGPSIARNEGILLSQGEWIGFVDSDDWIDENTYKVAYETAISKDVDIVQWGCRQETESTILSELKFAEGYFNINTNAAYFDPSTCYKLVNAKMIKYNNILFPKNMRLSEDRLFSFYCYLYSKNNYALENTFYHYRNNLNSSSHNMNEDNIKEEEKLIKEMEKQLNVFNLNKGEWNKLLNRQKIETKNHCIFLLKNPNFVLFRNVFPEVNVIILNTSFKLKLFYFSILKNYDYIAMLLYKMNKLKK